MNIGIIEDEPIAAKRLIMLIKEINPAIQIAFSLTSVDEVLESFEGGWQIDLLLSDIELSDGDVFSALSVIDIKCPIIFTTAYEHYLMDAFKVNGIGYLLKPFDKTSLIQAFDKYEQLKSNFTSFTPELMNTLQVLPLLDKKQTFKTRLTIKRSSGIELLKVSDISYIRLELSGPQAFDTTNKAYPLSDANLTTIESYLDPSVFFRLNRHEIVCIEAIERITTLGKDRLSINVSHRETALICSAGRTPLFRQWLEQ